MFVVVLFALAAWEGVASAQDDSTTTSAPPAPEEPTTTTTAVVGSTPPPEVDDSALGMVVRLVSFALGAGTSYVVLADRWA